MRPSRKRFVRAKSPMTMRRRATGDGGSISRYTNNASGRSAMKEALAEQRRKQQSLCAECGQFLEWSDCKFKYRECPDGVENVTIHKSKCQQSQ